MHKPGLSLLAQMHYLQETNMLNLVPHGIFFLSSPEIIALIVVTDFAITLAYFAIPVLPGILLCPAKRIPRHG